jgi:hypothetical protein
MQNEELEALALRVRDEPDATARAVLLGVDLPRLAGATSRFLVVSWAAGILVALVVVALPASRYFSLVIEHSGAVDWKGGVINAILGALAADILIGVGVGLTPLVDLLFDRIPGMNPAVKGVTNLLLVSAIVPAAAALAWIPFGSLPLFVHGTFAGAALAALPRPKNYQLAAAIRKNNPRITESVEANRRVASLRTLLAGRAGLMIAEAIGHVLAVTAGLLLISAVNWAVIPVVLANFLDRAALNGFKHRGHYGRAVLLQAAFGVVMTAVALLIAGRVLMPDVDWLAPAVPV